MQHRSSLEGRTAHNCCHESADVFACFHWLYKVSKVIPFLKWKGQKKSMPGVYMLIECWMLMHKAKSLWEKNLKKSWAWNTAKMKTTKMIIFREQPSLIFDSEILKCCQTSVNSLCVAVQSALPWLDFIKKAANTSEIAYKAWLLFFLAKLTILWWQHHI